MRQQTEEARQQWNASALGNTSKWMPTFLPMKPYIASCSDRKSARDIASRAQRKAKTHLRIPCTQLSRSRSWSSCWAAPAYTYGPVHKAAKKCIIIIKKKVSQLIKNALRNKSNPESRIIICFCVAQPFNLNKSIENCIVATRICPGSLENNSKCAHCKLQPPPPAPCELRDRKCTLNFAIDDNIHSLQYQVARSSDLR